MSYGEVAETMFRGGVTILPVSDGEFRCVSGDFTVTFTGTGFTYGAGNVLTGGQLDGYRVHNGGTDFANLEIVVESNFVLLTLDELNAAFAAFADGQYWPAVGIVTRSWEAEYFSHTNYAGGPMHGYGGGDFFSTGAPSYVEGRGGDDTILQGAGQDAVWGGSGGDDIRSGRGDDLAYGGTGDDHLRGEAGNDELYGGAGDDALLTGRGNDLAFGGQGNDHLIGEQGQDTLYGGAGDDTIAAGGHTRAYGGAGNDSITGRGGYDTLVGGTGNDSLYGGGGGDLLTGGAGDDSARGGAGNDWIGGEAGNDRLFGGLGDDTIGGGLGDDRIFGGAGSDLILGSCGTDRLYGGADADSFRFFADPTGRSKIHDFEDDLDLLDLSAFGFADAEAALALAIETPSGAVRFDIDGQLITVLDISKAQLADDLLV
jgi:Ca2+-binding RTX toxin-like protein